MSIHPLKIVQQLCFGFALFTTIAATAQNNQLLNRDFWKENPSLSQVQELVREGNDPSELNKYAFDPLIYALLEEAPDDITHYLFAQDGNNANKITHDGRTYLFWAAYKNNVSFMKHLVKNGATVNHIDDHGYSVLNFAAVTGQTNPELYNYLISLGANPKVEKDNNGANALLLLIPHLENKEMITFFLKKGLSLSDTDNNNYGTLEYASKGGNVSIVNWLNDQGVQPAQEPKTERNAIHFAAEGMRRHTNSDAIFHYLAALGLDVNQTDIEGNSPLHLYAFNGTDIATYEFFFEYGASPEIPNNAGNSALHNAALSNALEPVALLVNRVSNINETNAKGITALANAVAYNSPAVVEILLSNNANINLQDEQGNNLLYYLVEAYKNGSEDEYKAKEAMLLEKGFNFSQTQNNGNTLFHLGALTDIPYFISKSMELNIDVNQVNKEGYTALHLAAMNAKSIETLKLLTRAGADINATTTFEETPYQLAAENEQLSGNLEFLNPNK